MRRRGRIDRNQPEIVKALRQDGASVQSLADLGNGCPDILVGIRGQNHVLEIKDGLLPPSGRALTIDEKIWHTCWLGSVKTVESVEEAFKAVGI